MLLNPFLRSTIEEFTSSSRLLLAVSTFVGREGDGVRASCCGVRAAILFNFAELQAAW